MFWTAPELLRMHKAPRDGSQKGDVYSYGIICKEVITRNGPYTEYEEMDPIGKLYMYIVEYTDH